MDMMRMDAVVAVNVDDFDATVQSGVTRKSLNHYLRDVGLWFPVGNILLHFFCCLLKQVINSKYCAKHICRAC